MSDLHLLEALWLLPAAELVTPRAGEDAGPGGSWSRVPVLTGLQRQGDLIVLPVGVLPVAVRDRVAYLPTRPPVWLAGDPVVVLAGEHVHQLTGTGGATWAPTVTPAGSGRLILGVLTVPTDAGSPFLEDGDPAAFLEHTGHHASLGIGPGRYLLRRQRAVTPRPAAAPVWRTHND
jgi:hypothetical protein